MPSFAIPEPPPVHPPTPLPDIDRALDTLASRAPAWTRVSLAERVRLLEVIAERVASWARPKGEEGGALQDKIYGMIMKQFNDRDSRTFNPVEGYEHIVNVVKLDDFDV